MAAPGLEGMVEHGVEDRGAGTSLLQQPPALQRGAYGREPDPLVLPETVPPGVENRELRPANQRHGVYVVGFWKYWMQFKRSISGHKVIPV